MRQQLKFLTERLGGGQLVVRADLVAGEVGVLDSCGSEAGVTRDGFQRHRPEVIGDVCRAAIVSQAEGAGEIIVDVVGVPGGIDRHAAVDGQRRINDAVAISPAGV